MTPQKELKNFINLFRKIGTIERATQEKRYLKSSLKHFGVPVPDIRKAAGKFKKANRDLSREDMLDLVDILWNSEWYELKSLGIALLELYRVLLTARDMDLLEGMLDRCETWAHVDWIAPHVAGDLIERYEGCKINLEEWSRHDNFWLRRAAMLALLLPLRVGGGDFDLFSRFAESMLHDNEFFIRKAIGWILREVSRKRPGLTYTFLKKNIARLSNLTFKEGSRKLPDAQREELALLRTKG
jgi:3-methyladenine DNA glycosylase AlkD